MVFVQRIRSDRWLLPGCSPQGNWQWLAVPNYFNVGYWSFSAGLDANGNADFFGLSNYNDQLWRWTSSGGWTALGAPNTVWWVSATTNGQVAFIGMDGFLRKYDGNGNLHVLSTTEQYTELSGAADNDVYVVTWFGNDTLKERSAGGQWTTWDTNVW